MLRKTLYKKALSLVHQNHWGIEKTKHMIRESFWWPKMNNDVEDLVKTCPFCQAVTSSSQFEPLNPIYMPSHPWEYLYAELCSQFPTGENIFTVTDAYSRYPEHSVHWGINSPSKTPPLFFAKAPLTLKAPIPQNGQTHSNISSATADELFEYV